jgi:NADH:ubiquinone oxidoreductase subunit F (NADH-binding)
MTTELKTLKDMKFELIDDKGIGTYAIKVSDLKQEAIKWIKFMKNEYECNGCNHCVPGFIKEFFNITEEKFKLGVSLK